MLPIITLSIFNLIFNGNEMESSVIILKFYIKYLILIIFTMQSNLLNVELKYLLGPIHMNLNTISISDVPRKKNSESSFNLKCIVYKTYIF